MKDEDINAFMEDFSNSDGELKALWNSIPFEEVQAEPNLEETARFSERLSAYQDGFNDASDSKKRVKSPMQKKVIPFPFAPISIAAIFLLMLVSTSFYMIYRSEHKESTELQKLLALTLIQQNTAPQRIDGVRFASQLDGTESGLQKELIHILNNDPSINVRLSALNALRGEMTQSPMRERVIESISKQTSALVAMSICQEVLQTASSQEYAAIITQIEKSCIDSKRSTALKKSLSTHI